MDSNKSGTAEGNFQAFVSCKLTDLREAGAFSVLGTDVCAE